VGTVSEVEVRALVHRVTDRIPVVVQDGILALVVIAVSLIDLATTDDTMTPGEQRIASALLVTEGAVLVGRRVHPVLVWLAAGCLVSAYGLGPYPDPAMHFGALIAVYSVAAHTSRRTAAVTGAITLAAVVAVLLVDSDADLADWAVNVLTLATAWLLGDLMRTQRAYTAEVASRAAQREQQQAEEAHRAVLEERARISRELHDVTAHHVSVMAIQAEAGQALLPGSPDRAAQVLGRIADTARLALGDLRRLLGVLAAEDDEGDDDDGARAPQPGLDRLEDLVEQVRHAGLAVDLHVEGQVAPLPAAVDVSAYRIVQEALTNVLRHAGSARAGVVVRYGSGAVVVEVTDDGAPGSSTASTGPPGRGLVGMRERAWLLGGSLEAEPRQGGGFRVLATLPV
jgi:signal transduction histidine kinase